LDSSTSSEDLASLDRISVREILPAYLRLIDERRTLPAARARPRRPHSVDDRTHDRERSGDLPIANVTVSRQTVGRDRARVTVGVVSVEHRASADDSGAGNPSEPRTAACRLCGAETRPAGMKHSRFSDRTFGLHQCVACHFTSVDDPRTDFDVIYDGAYYNGRGADPLTDYESEMRNPNTVRRHEWSGTHRVVASIRPLDAECEWLDLGSGLGGLVRYLNDGGLADAIGSEDGHARTRSIERGIPCLTTEELRASGRRFDVITSIEVLEHVAEPMTFLRLVADLLKPGGIFYYTTGNASRFRSRMPEWNYVIPDIHVSFYEPGTLDLAFRRVGLIPEYVGRRPGFEEIIRYKTVKSLPRRVARIADAIVPWRLASKVIDRRYGVSAFPVGRKPV
jgi:SAM-dependent methyltransferase